MSGLPLPAALQSELRRLVAEHRNCCLWFLRPDYDPVTPEQALRVLRLIERYGDRDTFVRAAQLRQWLSRLSSATSAGS